MGHLGCFDLSQRHECLDAKNDPRMAIAALGPWECFWPKPGAALINGELRAAAAGALHSSGRSGRIPASRPPRGHAFSWPRDRRRGPRRQDLVAKTLWFPREALATAGAVEEPVDSNCPWSREWGHFRS